MALRFGKIADYVLDTLYPNLCPGCYRVLPSRTDFVCIYCEFSLPVTNYYAERGNPVEKLFWGRLELKAAASFMIFNHKGMAQRLVHQLKYYGNREIGAYLGRKFAQTFAGSEFIEGIDGIVPLPLHPKKLQERGYNQSEMIAEGMAAVLCVPVLTQSVVRLVNNVSQTRIGKEARQENVKDIFGLLPCHGLDGKHILVVDDTVTTGATLESIGRTMLQNSSCTLSFATLASVV